MMYTLINPEEVTIKRLVSAFQNAFIHIEHVDEVENELILSIEDNRVVISIFPKENILSLYIIRHAHLKKLTESMENNFFRELNSLQKDYWIPKLYAQFLNENDGTRLVVVEQHGKKYNFGLNIAELIDNCRILSKNSNNILRRISSYLDSNDMYLE